MKSQFWTAPNQITLIRLIFVPFVVINILGRNYRLALVLFVLAGLSDALDGLLARWLNQQTILGQYLDPIADKMLLSSAFLVLSFTKLVPWRYTVLVFSRDLFLMLIAAVLYSIFGKMNTAAQIGAIFFVLARQINPAPWIIVARKGFLVATMILTCVSAVHYIVITGHKLHASNGAGPQAPSSH